MKTLTQWLQVSVLGMLYLMVSALTLSAQDNSMADFGLAPHSEQGLVGGGPNATAMSQPEGGISPTSMADFGPAPRSEQGPGSGAPNATLLPINAVGINLLGTPANVLSRFDLAIPGTLFPGAATVQSLAGDFDPTINAIIAIRQTAPISFGRIDTATGVFTVIGATSPGAGETWTGMKIDPISGTIYATAVTLATTNIYTINRTTGAPTLVAAANGASLLIGFDFDNTGQMFGYTLNDSLYRINKTTGATTLLGYIGFNCNFAQDMDFDRTTGTCYLAAFNGALGRGELRIANLTTGNTTLVGPLGTNTQMDCFSVLGAPLSINAIGINLRGTPANALSRFDLAVPGTLITGAVTVQSFAGDFDPTINAILAIRQTPPISFGRIDTATGVFTVIGATSPGAGETWTGMKIDPTSGTIYATATTGPISNIYTINRTTGAPTLVAAANGVPFLIGFDFDNTGQMFGYSISVDSMYRINKTTGATTLLGYIGFDGNFAQDMDFDRTTGTCYLAAFNGALGRGELRIANLTTGNTTLVGPLGTNTQMDCFSVIAPPPPPGGTLSISRNGLNKAIPDNAPTTGVSDTINVSGIPAGLVIKKLTVKIDTVQHTWIGDMIFTLNHLTTTDTSINRIGRTGGAGFGNSCDNLIGTTLKDTVGPISVQNMTPTTCTTGGTANSTGLFNPYRPLSIYNNLNPNGLYILKITDNAVDDFGTLRAWSLQIDYGVQTGVGDDGNAVPTDYRLSQNYPNPFNPSTTIQYQLPNSANVSLKIYNLMGQEVATLVDGRQNAGTFQAVWNGRNLYGNQVASGIYFYSLVAKSADSKTTFTTIKKMLLLK